MQSDKIKVFSDGEGVKDALQETERFAGFVGLNEKDTMTLRLIAEETMGLVTAIAHDFDADFWVENESDGKCFVHLLAETRMNLSKKEELIDASTSKTNSAYTGFMGKIREMIENSIYSYEEVSALQAEYGGGPIMYASMGAMDFEAMPSSMMYMWSMDNYKNNVDEVRETSPAAQEAWDELEKSIMANIADDVKVSVKGDNVELVIEKQF